MRFKIFWTIIDIINMCYNFSVQYPKIKYRHIVLYWIDPQSNTEWKDINDVEKERPALCISCGWEINRTKDNVTITSDLACGDGKNIDSYGNCITIPLSSIIRQK